MFTVDVKQQYNMCASIWLQQQHHAILRVWSGIAKVLGNFPVPGRPTDLYYSRTRAYCACCRCGLGLFGILFSLIYPFSPLSPSLLKTARYRLKYCLKGPFNPKQPTQFCDLDLHVMVDWLWCLALFLGIFFSFDGYLWDQRVHTWSNSLYL